MAREAICRLLADLGLCKLVEVIANLVADGYAEDDVRHELKQMVKFGAVCHDGKHFWRP